jgi:hypothetical protein
MRDVMSAHAGARGRGPAGIEPDSENTLKSVVPQPLWQSVALPLEVTFCTATSGTAAAGAISATRRARTLV